MKIIGIDPGYDRLGIAIIEKEEKKKEILIYSECLQTSSKDSFYTRLEQVGQRVSDLIEKYSPEALAIESLFISKNQKTAMRVSEARGVIIYEAICHQIPVFEYTPLQIKIAVTGHGASDKAQMIKMLPILIKISNKKTHDDEYDAMAVALTCLASENKSFPQKK